MISVIIPSRDRPGPLARALRSLYATTQGHEIEVVVVLDEPDANSQAMVARDFPAVMVVVVSDAYLGYPGRKFNVGYRHTTGEWIVTGTDDIEFLPGWLEDALEIGKTYAVVGLHDQARGTAMLFVMRREYIDTEQSGRICFPWYHVWYSDIEIMQRAKQLGQYESVAAMSVKHYNSALPGGDPEDNLRRIVSVWAAHDEATWRRRKAAGYPDPDPDYCEPVGAPP